MSGKTLNARQWVEALEKEMKHFHLFEHFTPNYKMSPVAGKFYSRADVKLSQDPDAEPLVHHIQTELMKGPKDKSDYPVTTAQEYGWYVEDLIDLDKCDRRIHFCRQATPISKWGDYVTKFKSMTR